MRKTKRKGRRGFPQEGDRTLLGLVVFDCQMHGARAPVDGDIEITLAPFAVAGLQLGQVLDINVNKAKIILFEGSLSLYWSGRDRSGSAVQSLRLQNAPDAITIQVRQKMRDDEGQVIQSEVGDSAQRTDYRAFFLGRLPGQLVRPGGAIL